MLLKPLSFRCISSRFKTRLAAFNYLFDHHYLLFIIYPLSLFPFQKDTFSLFLLSGVLLYLNRIMNLQEWTQARPPEQGRYSPTVGANLAHYHCCSLSALSHWHLFKQHWINITAVLTVVFNLLLPGWNFGGLKDNMLMNLR